MVRHAQRVQQLQHEKELVEEARLASLRAVSHEKGRMMQTFSVGGMSFDRRGDPDSTSRNILHSLNASTRTLGARSHAGSALGATSNKLRVKKIMKLRQDSAERQFKSEVAKEMHQEI